MKEIRSPATMWMNLNTHGWGNWENNGHKPDLGSRRNERAGVNRNWKIGRPTGSGKTWVSAWGLYTRSQTQVQEARGTESRKLIWNWVFLSKAKFRTDAGCVGVMQGDHSLGQDWDVPSVRNRVKRENLKVGKEPPCTRPSQAEVGSGAQGSLEARCHLTISWKMRYFLCRLPQDAILSGDQESPNNHSHGHRVPLHCFSGTCMSARHSLKTWWGSR